MYIKSCLNHINEILECTNLFPCTLCIVNVAVVLVFNFSRRYAFDFHILSVDVEPCQCKNCSHDNQHTVIKGTELSLQINRLSYIIGMGMRRRRQDKRKQTSLLEEGERIYMAAYADKSIPFSSQVKNERRELVYSLPTPNNARPRKVVKVTERFYVGIGSRSVRLLLGV